MIPMTIFPIAITKAAKFFGSKTNSLDKHIVQTYIYIYICTSSSHTTL